MKDDPRRHRPSLGHRRQSHLYNPHDHLYNPLHLLLSGLVRVIVRDRRSLKRPWPSCLKMRRACVQCPHGFASPSPHTLLLLIILSLFLSLSTSL